MAEDISDVLQAGPGLSHLCCHGPSQDMGAGVTGKATAGECHPHRTAHDLCRDRRIERRALAHK